MTIEELGNELNAIIASWDNDFIPLYLATGTLKDEMGVRIFEEGMNTAGTKLPSPPYSTKEIYVDVKTLPNTPTAYQVGKRGTKIKSAYFPEGYKQLKQVVGRPVLELTNSLQLAFLNTPVLEEGNVAIISIPDDQRGKRLGLEAKYGTIFQMTDEEEKLLTDTLSFEITESLNKRLK